MNITPGDVETVRVLTATFIQIAPFLVTWIQERKNNKKITVAEMKDKMKEDIGKFQHSEVMNGIDFTQLKIDELAELVVTHFDELSKKLDCINAMVGTSLVKSEIAKAFNPPLLKQCLSEQALNILKEAYKDGFDTLKCYDNHSIKICGDHECYPEITSPTFLDDDICILETNNLIRFKDTSDSKHCKNYSPTRAGQAFYDSIKDSL